MKKKWIIIIVVSALIALIFQFGIQVGNVRIGKQNDLKTIQKNDFENSVFFKRYYNDNQLTVLNLWATWCEPCIAEMPMLNKVKEQFHSDVNFISISVDTDSLKLVKFLDTEKFKFTDLTFIDLPYRNAIINTLEKRPVDKWISSYTLPKTYLIKNGKVVTKIEGGIIEGELETLILKYSTLQE